MIAGGILLLIVSIELLTHGAWRFGGDARTDGSGVVPLAFPLLAGPELSLRLLFIPNKWNNCNNTFHCNSNCNYLSYTPASRSNIQISWQKRIYGCNASICCYSAAFAVQYIVEGVKQIYVTLI